MRHNASAKSDPVLATDFAVSPAMSRDPKPDPRFQRLSPSERQAWQRAYQRALRDYGNPTQAERIAWGAIASGVIEGVSKKKKTA